jgi:hypothetical protein
VPADAGRLRLVSTDAQVAERWSVGGILSGRGEEGRREERRMAQAESCCPRSHSSTISGALLNHNFCTNPWKRFGALGVKMLEQLALSPKKFSTLASLGNGETGGRPEASRSIGGRVGDAVANGNDFELRVFRNGLQACCQVPQILHCHGPAAAVE